ncbi:MAG TPA: helix-turn-helix domain-containing protein [Thermoanaerobaculia bacterium]|nr:helix-turn-helix domain-containing protein [Thermoanaerobaculia bacterium]
MAGELRRAIAADGRSIEAVGQAAGFSRSYLSQLLRGRQDLKLQHVERVLAVLELDPTAFLRRVQEALWDAGLASGPPMAVPRAGGARAGQVRDMVDPAAEEGTGRLGLRDVVREIVREELAHEVQAGTRKVFEGPRPDLALGFEEGAPASDRPRRGEEAEGRDQDAPAVERLLEILALPEEERAAVVRGNPDRYSGIDLARLLLDEARGHLPAEPRKVYALAGLIRVVLQHDRERPEAQKLYAVALAHQGNALKAQGELIPAEELLDSARFLLDACDTDSFQAHAELDRMEGSLRWAQGRFSEAESLFAGAAAVEEEAGRPVRAASVRLQLGLVYAETGQLDRAMESARRAGEVFSEHGETRLLLMARHNLAWHSLAAGDVDGSRALFTENLSLYDQFPDHWTQLRRLWLEGRLARVEGNADAAEDAFLAVRNGFLEQGVGYDAAMASLDLAFLYAENGRAADLKRLAEEIAPVFEAQDVHREAAAALMLFQEAVRTERASVRFLGELTRYLEQARRDPELRFRQPPE